MNGHKHTSSKQEFVHAKQLPDLNKCRAKQAGFGDYVDCLVARPEQCQFSLSFGNGHLCLHEERQKIAERTRR